MLYNYSGDNMKLLVSDYDNTFYTKDIQKNIEAVNKFMDDGNLFVIATGRNYLEIKTEIDEKDIKFNYLICNDGGIVFDHKYNVLYRKDIDNDISLKIIEIIKKSNKVISYKIDKGIEPIQNLNDTINGIICKIKSEKHGIKLLKKLENNYPMIHGYIVMPFLNITNRSVTKANGIKKLQKILKISNKDIYVIGDDINDVSMIEEYNGYLMQDAKILKKFEKNVVCSSVADLVDKIQNN